MTSYALNKAMYEASKPGAAERFRGDPSTFLDTYDLTSEERAALALPRFGELLARGGLPNLVYRYFRLHGFTAGDFHARLAAESTAAEQTASKR